jgi:hypothetical protein
MEFVALLLLQFNFLKNLFKEKLVTSTNEKSKLLNFQFSIITKIENKIYPIPDFKDYDLHNKVFFGFKNIILDNRSLLNLAPVVSETLNTANKSPTLS